MKHFFLLLLFGLLAYNPSFGQNENASNSASKENGPSNKELVEMYGLVSKSEKGYVAPRFKLYQTENMYILLKLNTATGAIWMLQYEMNDRKAALVPIAERDAAWVDEEGRPGRFELYPTKNMYTFIMLDTEKGTTYQVQWNTDLDKCFRQVLYY